jgi:hypothetical protein
MIGAPGRRAGGMVGYMFRNGRNDTDGPLALPADDGNLAAEWGPAADDARHRIFGFGHWRILGRLRVSGRSSRSRDCPGTRSPGRDDNGDTVTSDRPAGATRNTSRGAWTVDSGLRLGWDFGFGGPRTAARAVRR